MSKKTKAELIEELEKKEADIIVLRKEIENLERYKQYEESANEMAALREAFRNSGFSVTESFEMVKLMVTTSVAMLKR